MEHPNKGSEYYIAIFCRDSILYEFFYEKGDV